MKAEPEGEVLNGDNCAPITGDAIGNTAYSERFVLKILLKLANRDTLKEEINEPTFEEDLCTLWDMTEEEDVVLYLQSHDTFNLFYFALPVIESPRLIEIVIGTIANMCCKKQAVNSLLANKDLLLLLLEFLKSDDSQILKQLLRMVSSCLFVADPEEIHIWMELFETVEYPQAIYFILQNSSNEELLMTALENLNSVFSYCKIDGLNEKFSALFETPSALSAVLTAHREVSGQASPSTDIYRLHLITLQMMLHLDKVRDNDNSQGESDPTNTPTLNLLRDILISYESQMKECEKLDMDIFDVLEAAKLYVQYLDTDKSCSPDVYFNPCHRLWTALMSNPKTTHSGMLQFINDLKDGVASIMCVYLSKCSYKYLLTILENIGDDFGLVVSRIRDAELQAKIANRVLNYKNRLDVTCKLLKM